MKKNIIIFGSTGSIGKTTVKLLLENPNYFKIKLLTTNINYKLLFKQAKKLKVKNLIIFDKQIFEKVREKYKNKKINLFNSLEQFLKKNKSFKAELSVFGISGLEALKPLLNSIKISKKIAIANKETIICAWPLIKKKLKFYNCKIVPIDSEHFSIWKMLQSNENEEIEKIFITASGGPFLNKKLSDIHNIKPYIALKHPKWKMGKKISIDSATMMNKVFEVLEAKKLFNLDLSKIDIIIHPNSFIHSLIIFKNGTITSLGHETSMDIPIGNAMFKNFKYKKKKIKSIIQNYNSLRFNYPNKKQFPSLNFLKNINSYDSLYEVVLVSANDRLVKHFLEKKINYSKIYLYTKKLLNNPYFKGIINKKISSLKEINKLVNKVNVYIDNYI